MKLLVIGNSGQLANTLQLFRRPDLDILTVGRPACDVTRKDSVEAILSSYRPDVVLNAAAYTNVDGAESEPDLAFAINATGTANVARICAARDLTLIHISTDYVFSGDKSVPYVETDATAPLNVYGESKLAGENALRAAGCRCIILRTAWLHSPYGTNFVRTMLRLAQKTEISVVNDQFGSPTYALHVGEAIIAIAAALNGAYRWPRDCVIYHAAGSGCASRFELAREIFARASRIGGSAPRINAVPTAAYPTAARRPKSSCLDCGRLYRDFGLALPDWTVGVEHCVTALLRPHCTETS